MNGLQKRTSPSRTIMSGFMNKMKIEKHSYLHIDIKKGWLTDSRILSGYDSDGICYQ